MSKYTFKKVADHFKKSELYRTRKGIIHEEDPIMLDFISRHASNGDKILEVGGGSGAFLDLVIENSSIRKAYNLELVYDSYKNQVNKDICIIGGSALNLPFKDSSFNWIVIKNLLHHLVGRTRGESKIFAKDAVAELSRVTKDSGHIIILDQYNKSRFFSFVLFHITLFFSLFGISSKSFGLGKDVIVSFLTPDETKNLLVSTGNIKIISVVDHRINVPKHIKYALLMSNIGRIVLIGQIKK